MKVLTHKKLIIIIIYSLLLIGTIAVYQLTQIVKSNAVQTLSEYDALKTSELIFETMYVKMRDGWSKKDLNSILKRMEQMRENISIKSYRSLQTAEIMGEIKSEKNITLNDVFIQKAMDGKKQFIIKNDGNIRYLFPMIATKDCLKCHTNAKIGDVNGVLDITYSLSNIDNALDEIRNYFIIVFSIFLVLFLHLFYFILNKNIVGPVVRLTRQISDIADSNDLTKRVEIKTPVLEIRTLQKVFNRLLSTTKFYQDKLISAIHIDRLTSLGNLAKLQSDLSKRDDSSLIIININSFKELNSFYGLNVGDYILKEFAVQLEILFGKSGIYRIYADEFAIILDDKYIEEMMINDILQRLQKHNYIYKNSNILIYLRAGYVHQESENMVEKATLAIKCAKASKLNFKVYDKSMEIEDEYTQNIIWSKRIKSAIDDSRVITYYMPLKNTKTGKIDKYETLVRITEGDNIYTPDSFIEIAEKAGLYPSLTQEIIKSSFKYFSDKPNVTFSINFAISDILNQDTTNVFFEQLEKYNIGKRVVIELLETHELSDNDTMSIFIQQVKSYGVKIAIDDFGTGYSNFEYVIKLNIDFLKLDGSLVENITIDDEAKRILYHIIDFGKKIGIKIVAERVKNKEIESMLIDMGVDYLQGYYIGKPAKDIL